VPKCILIVDDYAAIRKSIRSFLESQTGFEVCGEAVDGLDAIEKARELKPDLIILDLAMPRMNGLEATRVLRRMLPDTPIVLFTSYDAVTEYSDATALGIQAVVVSKSAGLDALVQQVQGLLEPA